ncbi:imm11 family protein [Hyalangium rubrum]|uniref:Immunity MXAN-0049 protein domain-containing protein n=1 Tax=Hyalangium rubrum TaxID=3103134 RepID=A0ABU5HB06_9BACT|nr:DUF1629 domain-containing protein [Hyalangium sp. s54d21]MDY7230008.1 hypothetical protein [Hyalangium sp. s54d21]
MPTRFFDLTDDVQVPHRWHLATPIDSAGSKVHDWDFTCGAPVSRPGRLRIPVEVEGRALDFTEAGLGIAVVHVRVAAVFAELASDEVQLIPASVEGQPDPYQILVATRRIRCIDEQASRILLWTHEDGAPDRVGQYRDVRDMRIDKAMAGDAKVFRPEGWEVALVVSGDIKDALERVGATGLKFKEV